MTPSKGASITAHEAPTRAASAPADAPASAAACFGDTRVRECHARFRRAQSRHRLIQLIVGRGLALVEQRDALVVGRRERERRARGLALGFCGAPALLGRLVAGHGAALLGREVAILEPHEHLPAADAAARAATSTSSTGASNRLVMCCGGAGTHDTARVITSPAGRRSLP